MMIFDASLFDVLHVILKLLVVLHALKKGIMATTLVARLAENINNLKLNMLPIPCEL